MRITVLGSGGNSTIPWPGCHCHVCVNASKKGGRELRFGNCVFVHDESILFEAPEHIFYQLAKNKIPKVKYLFISHWHPDHCAGIRLLQVPHNIMKPLKEKEKITLILPKKTKDLIVKRVSPALNHYVKNYARLRIIEEEKPFKLGKIKVTLFGAPIFPGKPNEVFYFLLESKGKKVLIGLDETRYLPLEKIPKLDLLIKECGYFFEDAQGKTLIKRGIKKVNHIDVTHELPFEDSLKQISFLNPKKTVLTEIEEIYGRTYADFAKLEKKLKKQRVRFAFDGMELKV